MTKFRAVLQQRPVASTLVALVLGLIIGAGVLAIPLASTSDEVDQLEADLDASMSAQEEAEDAQADAEEEAAAIRSRRAAIVESARDEADSLVDDARAEVSRLRGRLSQLESQVSSATSQLEQVEGELDSARETQQLSSFGDGIWQSGTDFLPGLYRAPGGSSCYWALLNTADTQDIISNGGFSPNQTLEIDSPWFETSGCGKWEKIG